MTGGDANVVQSKTWPVRVRRPGERRSMSRSATRALDILDYFGQARRPLRAVEIARALELHPSTTNQLLKTMVEAAHLVFDARTKTYLPSHRLAHFGAWVVESYGADERLRALLREVQAATGHVVTLSTPNDLFMQLLDLVGATPTATPPQRGLRISVFGSAIGTAYISSLSDEEIVHLAKRARLPDAEIAEALAGAEEVRREGLAEGPSVDGSVWSIAAPLPASASPVHLVLGLSGPREAVFTDRPRIGEIMRSAVAGWAE